MTWHGTSLNEPLWDDPDAQILAYTLGRQREEEEDLHIIFNMSDQGVEMPLPPLSGRAWHRAVDTGQPSPGDILEPAIRTGLRIPPVMFRRIASWFLRAGVKKIRETATDQLQNTIRK